MPTGPVNRVADNSRAKKLLEWEPKFSLREGLKPTIEWYKAHRTPEQAKRILTGGGLFNERKTSDLLKQKV
jgi:dTDP-D-glucose 4,6-dehydratase